MCYEALYNGDATEESVATILRAELRDALVNGLAAAVIVASVLFGRGADPATLLGLALAAFSLGAVLHQALLVGGVAVQRARHGSVEPSDPAA